MAIIMILIILALIFVIRFVILKKPVEYKKEYTQVELASNMINTLLRTTANDCNGLSFTELFQDCADYPSDGSVDCSVGVKSCLYLKTKIPVIFDNTLEGWNIAYYFKAVSGITTLVSDECADCDPNSICPVRTHKEFPIPSATTINIILDICG